MVVERRGRFDSFVKYVFSSCFFFYSCFSTCESGLGRLKFWFTLLGGFTISAAPLMPCLLTKDQSCISELGIVQWVKNDFLKGETWPEVFFVLYVPLNQCVYEEFKSNKGSICNDISLDSCVKLQIGYWMDLTHSAAVYWVKNKHVARINPSSSSLLWPHS